MHNRLTIVVASCLSYRDAWVPFLGLLNHYWPERTNYDLLLVSDVVDKAQWPLEPYYEVGEDKGWAKNVVEGIVKAALTPYILFLQEDFFLTSQVDNAFIERALDRMDRHQDIFCTRLMPCPGPDMPFDEDVGLIDLRAPYRVSCQAAIWQTSALIEILDHPEIDSPFDFEIKGTMIKPHGTYAAAYREKKFPFEYLVSAISRGKWNPDAFRICASLNIPIPLRYREVEK